MRYTDSISSMGYFRVDQLLLLSEEFILRIFWNEENYVDMPRGLDKTTGIFIYYIVLLRLLEQ